MDRRRFLTGTAGVAGAAVATRAQAQTERAAPPSPLSAFLEDQLRGTGFGGTILVSARGEVERHAYGLPSAPSRRHARPTRPTGSLRSPS